MCCLKPYGLLSITDTSPATLLNALRMLLSFSLCVSCHPSDLSEEEGVLWPQPGSMKSDKFLSKSSSLPFHSHHSIPFLHCKAD